MSDPVELEDNFILVISDQGVATPEDHAASHAAAGSDPLTLTLAQISNAGTIASQAANSVTITGGTISVSSVTATSVNLDGGTIDGTVIGGTTRAAGSFTAVVGTTGTFSAGVSGTTGAFSGNTTIGGTLAVTGAVTLTAPLAVAQGGTGATSQAGAQAALGFGTMASQNKTSVDIEGGTIDATAIGGTTKAAGGFTNLTVTGTVTLTTALPIAQGGTGATSDSAARTALGLVIGTNVQAYDADLAAIAGLTSAANKGLYFTGSGTAATFDLTSTGRSLGGVADAAAARTLLGITHGRATLVAGTVDVVDAAIVAASSTVILSSMGPGGTPGLLSAALTDGVGFTINSDSATDTSIIGYFVIH